MRNVIISSIAGFVVGVSSFALFMHWIYLDQDWAMQLGRTSEIKINQAILVALDEGRLDDVRKQITYRIDAGILNLAHEREKSEIPPGANAVLQDVARYRNRSDYAPVGYVGYNEGGDPRVIVILSEYER